MKVALFAIVLILGAVATLALESPLDEKIGALNQLKKDQNKFTSLANHADQNEVKWRNALKAASHELNLITASIDDNTYWQDIEVKFMAAYRKFNIAYQAWLRYDFLDLNYNNLEDYYDAEEEAVQDYIDDANADAAEDARADAAEDAAADAAEAAAELAAEHAAEAAAAAAELAAERAAEAADNQVA
eukprot:TRINITY_DN819_c0_g2_i2.p1 TRINITY_DN819_c0_g2~~TRINITY_DN819_c0_g2_i2.p1  ORF type:complete len:188 (+),score=108.26 TRINITY_DN819_c0_g2_i2:76-639(+)